MILKRLSKKWRTTLGVLVVLVVSVSAVKVVTMFEVTKNLEIFTSVYKEVHLNYVEEVNAGELMKTGIDAMLASLDPYTNYYTESQAEDALIQRKGDFGTPGIDIELLQGNVVVTSVKSGSSAEVQGLRLGDILLEINGRDFSTKPVSEIYQTFDGATGSFLKIKVKRGEELLDFNLERQKLDFKNVPYFGMINTDIGYIKLDQFMDNSAQEVKDAFIDLRSKNNLKGIVLDLRNNGGGLLIDAVRILNLFVNKHELLVVTRGRTEAAYTEYRTFDNPIDTLIPLVVLINENSASASEIVSGTIQDLDRGVVIGKNSFGKGLVQNVLSLPYRNQMKVTIAKYYIPSGRCIQLIDYSKNKTSDSAAKKTVFFTKNKRKVYEGNGIKPDLEVERRVDNEFLKALKNSNYIFQFATQYHKQNPDSVSMENFKLKSNVFEEFKKFCELNNLTYTTQTELQIEKLKKSSENESYNKDINDLISSLTSNLNKSKEKDWERYKADILPILEVEIAKRYYGESSLYPIVFRHDKEIHTSLEILSSPAKYSKFLLP